MGIPIVFDKPFKTYEEQIEYLRDNYNLLIENTETAKYILSTFSYYDIINGYQECMMQNGKFKSGISIMYLYLFYRFDKEFQNIIFKNILIIENSFKTKLAYTISKNYGVSIYDYLDKTNYKPGYKGKVFFNVLKEKIFRDIGKIDNHNSLVTCTTQPCKHYFEVHHHVPAWILMKNISFDKAITLYLLLKPKVKAEVTNYLIHGNTKIQDKISLLTSALTLIRKFRNIIAHNLKFVTYTQKSSKLPYKTTLNILNDKNITDGISNFDDIYACILAIFILLNDSKEQIALLDDLYKHLSGVFFGPELPTTLKTKIATDYLAITNLTNRFNIRLLALMRICINKSDMSSHSKLEFINSCNNMVSILSKQSNI